MKRQKRLKRRSELVDEDFAEGLIGSQNGNRSFNLKVQRKTQQLCRQVQRVLNLALTDGSIGDSGCDVFVEEVSPGLNGGHLLVHIGVPEGHSVAGALVALRRDAPRLRIEVAMAIARKRVPELFFMPVTPGGSNHE